MNKNVRNLVIVAVLALIVGYIAGGASQTGHCPITGIVLWKQKAACYDKMKECETSCDTKKEGAEADEANAPDAPATGAAK
jgi:hypothetical protein